MGRLNWQGHIRRSRAQLRTLSEHSMQHVTPDLDRAPSCPAQGRMHADNTTTCTILAAAGGMPPPTEAHPGCPAPARSQPTQSTRPVANPRRGRVRARRRTHWHSWREASLKAATSWAWARPDRPTTPTTGSRASVLNRACSAASARSVTCGANGGGAWGRDGTERCWTERQRATQLGTTPPVCKL